uniref:Uncharacterized protein n=1 Tax=Arundo donax TaxID=35708 RepID=A0A0A8ZDI6_ARUDO
MPMNRLSFIGSCYCCPLTFYNWCTSCA